MLQSSIIKFTNKWLRSIDILCLSLLLCLMTLGILFVTTASPSIAKLKGLEELNILMLSRFLPLFHAPLWFVYVLGKQRFTQTKFFTHLGTKQLLLMTVNRHLCDART